MLVIIYIYIVTVYCIGLRITVKRGKTPTVLRKLIGGGGGVRLWADPTPVSSVRPVQFVDMTTLNMNVCISTAMKHTAIVHCYSV